MKPIKLLLCLLLAGCAVRGGLYAAPPAVYVGPGYYAQPRYYERPARYYAPRDCYHLTQCAPDRMCCYDHWGNNIGWVTP
jgi:hypothetical protein